MKESSAQDYALLVRGVSLSEHCWSVPISGSSRILSLASVVVVVVARVALQAAL